MITLDGSALSIDDLVAVARGAAQVRVASTVAEQMAPARRIVEGIDTRDEIVYGVTTGFGALADRVIGHDDRVQLQRSFVLSHAAGMGRTLDPEQVRGMMLLRARTLAVGRSGVRVDLVEAIVNLLNAGIVPLVPEHGSLGASGDLAQLAHAAAVLIGEGAVLGDSGTASPAISALHAAGITPLILRAKEGLALVNGTDAMAATLALAVHDLRVLLIAADCACAMSVEALYGTTTAFSEEVVALRRSPGVQSSAHNLRTLLAGSPIIDWHRPSHHAVQDAYSLRCAPQVHGAARDVVAFAADTVNRELDSVVDNPIVAAAAGEVLSAGNFHGQALAYAADMAASACADLASISERRLDRMLDPARSRGLPAFLTEDPGLNSGLMIAHYTAAACVGDLRQAASPFAVHSAVTSAGQEDHVSMGWAAAMRTRRSVELLRRVLAVEFVGAAQALELRAPRRPAPATGAILDSLRTGVAHLDADRFLGDDLAGAESWLRDAGWLTAAVEVGGELS